MPVIEHHFNVNADSTAARALLGDLSKVYYLFPSFASAEKASPDGYRWHLKANVELEAGARFLTARVLKEWPDMIEWEAVSSTMVWKGTFGWTPKDKHTQISLRLDIRDVGIGGSMHEALLSVELPDLARFFQTRTREILEAKPWLDGLP